MELGLPFSPLCDRKATMIAQSQIGTNLILLRASVYYIYKEMLMLLKLTPLVC